MLARVDYNQQQHQVYARGRAITPESVSVWMRAFETRVPSKRPLQVLDLGSGTGRFTPTLAQTFGGPVFGVEPSHKMREIAEAESSHPGVTYLAGEAEHIPLADGSIDFVLMFLSIHHVPDRWAAAREIGRVLRPGGRVLIRNTFSDRMPDLRWHRYFPRAKEIEMLMFPTAVEVQTEFAAAGFRTVSLEPVREANGGQSGGKRAAVTIEGDFNV